MKYTHILFDLDGTLTDSAPGILNCVAYALSRFSIDVPDKKVLLPFIGPPLSSAFSEQYGFTKEQSELARDYYRERYSTIGLYENSLYDGIAELLAALHSEGRHVILATAKPQEFSERILEHFGIAMYFDVVVGASLDNSLVEKADIIAKALALSHAEREHAIMIGDRCYDIDGANSSKIDSCGVLYGFGSRQELENCNATYIAESVSALSALLKNNQTEV